MGDRIIAYTGKLLIHAVRALLVCWQRMLRLGLSVGVLSGIVALVFGTYVTHTFPPAPLTWVAALFFGVALGYAAAMTVLADEMLLSIFEAIRLLEGDVRAGMRAAAVAAEREAGEAGRGIMRFLGHSRSTPVETASPSPKAPPSAQPLVTVSSVARHGLGQDQANETLAAIAATESFINTTPRPAVNARPVRAADLPRIGWANDDTAIQRAPEAVVVAAPALAEMPPLPVRSLRSQPRAAVAATNDASATLPADVYVGTVGRVAMWDDAETQPAAEEEGGGGQAEAPAARQDDVAQHSAVDEAPVGIAAEETASGDAAANAETQETTPSGDATPATDRPPAATTQPIEPDQEERGIWARIGQALIGNTTVPLREAGHAGNPSSEASETGAP